MGAEYSLTAVTCTFAGNPGRGYPRFGHVQEIHPIPRPVGTVASTDGELGQAVLMHRRHFGLPVPTLGFGSRRR